MKLVCLAFGALAISLTTGCGGSGGTGGSSTGGDGGDIGRIYISDTDHHRIVRMDNIQGDDWTSFGVFGSGVNQLKSPSCVTFDDQGRIYIADTGNHRIVRMNDFTGAGWITYGTSGSGVGQFQTPSKLVIDGQDRIYILDTGNDRVVRIDDMSGTNWVSYGSEGNAMGNFDKPFGLAVDSDFHIYVCDSLNGRIVRFDNMSGANWTVFTDANLIAPVDMKIYGNKMLIADRQTGVILTGLMSATGWKSFYLENAQSVCMGTGGKAYTVDQGIQLLSQYSSMDDGTPVTYGTLGQHEFDSPVHVTFGP